MKNGWQTKKLVDVATLQRGFDLPTQDRGSGEIPLVSSSGISDTHDTSAVRGPGVVTGRSGSIGNVFFIERDFWPLNTVLYVKDFHGNDPRFVYYLLTKFDLKRFASGAGVPTLNRNFVHDELVDVPSLPQQRRIVGILDEAFDGIATARATADENLKNARALFESALQAVFAQGGPAWKIALLSSVLAEQPRNGWSPPAEYQNGSGNPVLTLSAVTGFEYDGSRVKLSSVPTREHAHYWLKPGELLITRSNTQELVGHVAIYDGIPARAICCDLIMKMIVDPSKALTRFIYFYLRSPNARSYLTSRAHGASSTMKKIGKQVVQNIPVPLPSITQQEAIATKLDALAAETQRLESLYQQKLNALDALKKSLLHQAFSGQL